MFKLVLILSLAVYRSASGVPQSFSLLVETKNEDINIFYRFINYYGSIKCQPIVSIDVVWNRAEGSEKSKQYTNQASAIRPVYFYDGESSTGRSSTGESSTGRSSAFRIPKESSSDYFYRAFVDMNLTCQQLLVRFEKVKLHMVAGIPPLFGQKTSYLKVHMAIDLIMYENLETSKHFQFIEDISFISRHIIEVSQSEAIQVYVPNERSAQCEEIRMNFIVAMLYPELTSVYFAPLFESKFRKSKQGGEEKNTCIRTYMNHLGYCPVMYQRKKWKGALFSNSEKVNILELKKAEVIRRILSPKQAKHEQYIEAIPQTQANSQTQANPRRVLIESPSPTLSIPSVSPQFLLITFIAALLAINWILLKNTPNLIFLKKTP